MSRFQRVRSVLLGIAAIVVGIEVLAAPGENGLLVAMLLIIGMVLVAGLRLIGSYLSMGRHMVGGLSLLVRGIIMLDVAAFAFTIVDEPNLYVALYLLGANFYAGGTAAFRVLDAYKTGARHWRLTLAHSVLSIGLAVACLVYLGNQDVLKLIFCISLFTSGFARITRSLTETDVIHIA